MRNNPPIPGIFRSAFSLVELLAVIGIIAVLLGLMIPVLSGARKQGVRTALLAGQRQAMLAVETYSSDFDLAYPCFGKPETMVARIQWHGEDVWLDWWQQPEYWGWFLATRGYAGHASMGPNAPEDIYEHAEGCPSCGFDRRSFHMLSATVFADPSLFVDGATVESALHRGTRSTEVRSTSDKVVLYQFWFANPPDTPVDRRKELAHFADGHGEWLPIGVLSPGVDASLPFAGFPGMCTRDGIRGRDR